MPTPSISEPFVLSTYATSQTLQQSGAAKKQRLPQSIFATHAKASGSSEGYATVTVQADGVHVLDVSALHAVVSHTLGPSTAFCCPAVTRSTREGTETICTTYAAIASSVDLDAQGAGRTIWTWRENLSSPLADRASRKKKSVLIPHEISGLLTCDELPARLLAYSSRAEVTVIDDNLNVKGTWSPSKTQKIVRAFIFSRIPCPFIPRRSTPSRGAILVLIVIRDRVTQVVVLSLGEDDAFLELGDCSVQLGPEQITDISCNNTGHITFLTRNGTWHSHLLESTDGNSITISSVADPFRLTGLLFIGKDQFREGISLLSLTSSHVLLSALTSTATPEIVLLLWDLQFSVLLASQALPVPSTFLQSKDIAIKVNLVSATNSQALLVLSPLGVNSGDKTQTTSRSSVLVIPFLCPSISTIANAMGQASAGTRWVDQAFMSTSSSSPSQPPQDPVRTKVLTTMRATMEKNLPQAANVAFFEWEKRESQAAGKITDSATAPGTSVPQPVLNHAFVKDLLTTVLQPSKPSNTPYSPEVVRYLLNRQLASGHMVDGGLLGALRSKNDWQSIELAFAKVPDLSETEIVECLCLTIAQHRQKEATSRGAEAMEVDPVPALPSLPSFLSSCVVYTSTPAALRSAMRHSLRDADDILCVLKVLENWIHRWMSKDAKLLPSKKDIRKDVHGIPVLKLRAKEDKDLPALEKILDFLQTLLDASFLVVLAHPSAHRILRNIRSYVEPQISHNEELEELRSPLESFAKAHVKAVREAGEGKKKKAVLDWRRRRKEAHEQAGLLVGLYQVEELVL